MLLRARLINFCLGLLIMTVGVVAPKTMAKLFKEAVQELEKEGVFR